jgi:hypothetical protein
MVNVIPVLERMIGFVATEATDRMVPGYAVKVIPLETDATVLPPVVINIEKLPVGLL